MISDRWNTLFAGQLSLTTDFLYKYMGETVNTLHKAERLNSKLAIENLFSGRAKSLSVFPLRAVFIPVEINENTPAAILISVPKKRFKRAVKRNRVKRQVREAYRKNKHELSHFLRERHSGVHLAFIYLDDKLRPSEEIECKVKILLDRVMDRLGTTE